MVDRLDREDIRYLLVAGLAPAWFNVLDLRRIHDHTDLPVVSVTFESSPGLEGAIREAFDDPNVVQDRLATYRAQPERRPVSVNDETVYVRSVGIDDSAAADVVRAFTPEGGRPEPLRVARRQREEWPRWSESDSGSGRPATPRHWSSRQWNWPSYCGRRHSEKSLLLSILVSESLRD